MFDSNAHFHAPDTTGPKVAGRFVNGNASNITIGSYTRAFILSEIMTVIVAATAAKIAYINLYLGQTQPILPYIIPAILLGITFHYCAKQAGLYESTALVAPVVSYGKLLAATALAFLILLGILYILKISEEVSRGWFLTWFVLTAASLFALRAVATRRVRHLVASGALRHKIAIVGTDEFARDLKAQVEGSAPSLEVGEVTIVSGRDDASLADELARIKDALARQEIETVVIGIPAAKTRLIQKTVQELGAYSTELLVCSELEPYPVAVDGSRNLGSARANVVTLVPQSERHRVLKGLLDYAVAGVALFLLAPLLAVVAIAIKLDSPGPVFFRQRRLGQNNQVFRIFKFRTMTVAEDGERVIQAQRNDPRVTRVGKFLRRTSLDELPQLINVLTGTMSLVGPRPHAVAHDEEFEQKLDLFSRRRRVRPGLTGWAQVHGYRGETRTTADIRHRMQHDLYYIDNWSLWLDMEIMVRTAFVLFRGAY